MKNRNCDEVMDELYGFSGEEIPLPQRLRAAFHLFFCPRCAQEARKLKLLEELSGSDFFPPAPSFEAKVMERLPQELFSDEIEAVPAEIPGGFSFRSWVIIGLVVLVSLASPFFGMDFLEAARQDSSLLIPLGITVGTVLTGYGAFFIASHLKELSEHFKIH